MRAARVRKPILLLLVGLSGLIFCILMLMREEEWATNDLYWPREDPSEEPPLFI